MIVEFRRLGYAYVAIQIHGEPVEIVNWHKHLGTISKDTLKRDLNTEAITKDQRLHLLRKLRSFNVDPTILKLLYNSFIESVLTFSFICWFYNLNAKQRNPSQKLLNFSCKIICDQ